MDKIMSFLNKKLDTLLLFLLILVIIGIPFGIHVYNQRVWQAKIPTEAKEFTLTGHAQKGWLLGEIHAYDAVSLWRNLGPFERPVVRVEKGSGGSSPC